MRQRVSGARLAQHIGEDVVLLGKVTKVNATGKNIEIQTTDDVQVNVTLPEAVDGLVEGYIEIYGTAKSKSTVQSNSYILLSEDMTKDFDVNNYNDALSVLNILGDKKWRTPGCSLICY